MFRKLNIILQFYFAIPKSNLLTKNSMYSAYNMKVSSKNMNISVDKANKGFVFSSVGLLILQILLPMTKCPEYNWM